MVLTDRKNKGTQYIKLCALADPTESGSVNVLEVRMIEIDSLIKAFEECGNENRMAE